MDDTAKRGKVDATIAYLERLPVALYPIVFGFLKPREVVRCWLVCSKLSGVRARWTSFRVESTLELKQIACYAELAAVTDIRLIDADFYPAVLSLVQLTSACLLDHDYPARVVGVTDELARFECRKAETLMSRCTAASLRGFIVSGTALNLRELVLIPVTCEEAARCCALFPALESVHFDLHQSQHNTLFLPQMPKLKRLVLKSRSEVETFTSRV